MKLVQTSVIAGFAFFLSTGISFGAEMDDLDITIRVVDTDGVAEMENELTLPETVSDTAREHAESEDSRGLTQANDAQTGESDAAHAHEVEDTAEVRDEHEDEVETHDETRDTTEDVNAERNDAKEDEVHEEENKDVSENNR